jgi:hypothetical protein
MSNRFRRPRMGLEAPFLVTLVCLGHSVAMAGSEHILYLDFDHDGDLYTIQQVSHQEIDTVSVIVEIGDGPIYPSGLWLVPDVDCCTRPLEWPYLGVDFCYEEDWCNEFLLKNCAWIGPLDPTDGDVCTQLSLSAELRPGVPLSPGRRYLLGAFCLKRIIADECYPTPAGYLRLEVEGAFGDILSNYVFIGPDAPASVPEEVPPRGRPVTWGILKMLHR